MIMQNIQQKLIDRLVKFAKIDSQVITAKAGICCPTNVAQLDMSRAIIAELESLNIPYYSDDKGFVIGRIKGNKVGDTIAFMAHIDTAEGYNASGVKPIVHNNYDGSKIVLKNNIVLDPSNDKKLATAVGDSIVTADGTSLLGSDDKAGIAIMLTFAEALLADKTASYSDIELIFTPDEEGGDGMSSFPLSEIKASYAYTIDGGELGELEYECYYASHATLSFKGVAIHPGYARGKMVNALSMAASFINLLPRNESPEATDGYYGCYWADSLNGNTEHATLSIQVRDHDKALLEQRLKALASYKTAIEAAYPHGQISLEIKEQYLNMREAVQSKPIVMNKALRALELANVKPIIKPIRGGTDGARLSAMGIPCPNLFTGNHNAHGPYEWVSVQAMQKSTEVLLSLVKL